MATGPCLILVGACSLGSRVGCHARVSSRKVRGIDDMKYVRRSTEFVYPEREDRIKHFVNIREFNRRDLRGLIEPERIYVLAF